MTNRVFDGADRSVILIRKMSFGIAHDILQRHARQYIQVNTIAESPSAALLVA